MPLGMDRADLILPIIASLPRLPRIDFAYRHACLDLGKIPPLEPRIHISLMLGSIAQFLPVSLDYIDQARGFSHSSYIINPKVWEAVKEEILKWLNSEIIYPISNSQ